MGACSLGYPHQFDFNSPSAIHLLRISLGSASAEKPTFAPGCPDKVKEFASHKDTRSTLLLIWWEEPTSHAGETMLQAAFDADTDKESSGEGSDGGETELDYEDLGVLPDAEETAMDDDIIMVDTCPPAVKPSSPVCLDKDDATNTQETIDEGVKGKKSSGPWDGTVSGHCHSHSRHHSSSSSHWG